jgi:hypothetical protein
MLIVGSIEIGPAYAAAHSHGTPGYFIALRTNACKQPSDCSWDGNFTSENGQDVRQNVQMDGTWTGVRIGTRIPALDSGDRQCRPQVRTIHIRPSISSRTASR